jgi:hypothetical protein
MATDWMLYDIMETIQLNGQIFRGLLVAEVLDTEAVR